MPGHVAVVRYSLGTNVNTPFFSTLGTNVNTPFFQEPTLKFGHSAGAQVQGLDLVLRHNSGHRVLVCKAFLFSYGAVHCFVLATKLIFQNGV